MGLSHYPDGMPLSALDGYRGTEKVHHTISATLLIDIYCTVDDGEPADKVRDMLKAFCKQFSLPNLEVDADLDEFAVDTEMVDD